MTDDQKTIRNQAIVIILLSIMVIMNAILSFTRDYESDYIEQGWFQYDDEYYKVEKIDNSLLEDEDGDLFEVHRNKLDMKEKEDD